MGGDAETGNFASGGQSVGSCELAAGVARGVGGLVLLSGMGKMLALVALFLAITLLRLHTCCMFSFLQSHLVCNLLC